MAGDGGGEATLPPPDRALSLDTTQREDDRGQGSLTVLSRISTAAEAHVTHHSGPKLSVSAAIVGLGVFLKGRGWGGGDLAFTLLTPVGEQGHGE